jgi:hypothetical protein
MPPSKKKQIKKILNKVYTQVAGSNLPDIEIKKDIIVIVGGTPKYIVDTILEYAKKEKRPIRLMLLYNHKKKFGDSSMVWHEDLFDFLIPCDMNSDISIQKALLPMSDEILTITCRQEQYISYFANVIPHVPYLYTPTSESLHWSSDKILMRKRLRTHNKSITPIFTVIEDSSKKSITKAIEKVGFPLIVKPSGLAASRLVTMCFHREELEKTLKLIFKKIESGYKEHDVPTKPQVLIEQFMDGPMYSIDAYVSRRGKVTFCPMVSVKTGKQIGFDDFFGYQQMTPTLLSKENTLSAEYVAREAVHALALRSTSAHIELLKTEQGWKVIEVAARLGGFRSQMYQYSFGFDHTINDILIRIPEKVSVSRTIKGHTVAMKFFAKKEGYITKLTGTKKIQELESFRDISINKSVGDQCTYAKNGGSSVFNLIMFNTERSRLLADIRRVEQTVKIETSRENTKNIK